MTFFLSQIENHNTNSKNLKSTSMKKLALIIVLLNILCLAVFAQEKTISGKVLNEYNEPAAGATIKIKGSKQSAVADQSGAFKMKVPALPVVIEISYTEYETEEITINGEDVVSIIMQRAERNLNPVVIGSDRVKRKMANTAVPIERAGKFDFQNSPTSPYNHLLSKKNMDATVSGMLFTTYSTRGFNGSGINHTSITACSYLPGFCPAV